MMQIAPEPPVARQILALIHELRATLIEAGLIYPELPAAPASPAAIDGAEHDHPAVGAHA